jgi:hypothetical protein
VGDAVIGFGVAILILDQAWVGATDADTRPST